MTKQAILDAIEEYITGNGLQEITGQVMNVILTAIAKMIPDDNMLTSSFGGVVTPISTITVTPGKSRWYFANPGTYPNAGGFTFSENKLNILSYNGSNWEGNTIALPSGTAKKNFDKSDNESPSTMMATADRYDWTTDALQSFGSASNSGNITPTWTPNSIRYGGVITPNSSHSLSAITIPSGFKYINFNGPLWRSNESVTTSPTIMAKMNDGTFKVLLEGGGTVGTVVQRSFYIEGVAIIYVNSTNTTLNNFTLNFSVKGINSVQNYIDYKITEASKSLDFSKSIETAYTNIKYTRISNVDFTTGVSGVLKNDNTLSSTPTDYLSIQNIPTNGAKHFFYCARPLQGNDVSVNQYAGVIGIKTSGEIVVLVKGTTTANETIVMLDVSSFEKISICWSAPLVTNGWTPVFSFYNSSKEVKLPDYPFKKKNIALTADTQRGAVCFIDDDIYSEATAKLIPFYQKNDIPFAMACIAKSMRASFLIRDRLIGFNNIGICEIMNHTEDHPSNMNTADYATQLNQIKSCKDYLDSLGIKHDAYVSPYGRFNQTTLDIMGELGYNFHYRFDAASDGINSVDTFFNLGIYRLSFGVTISGTPASLTVAQVKAAIDKARAENKLVVITTHYRNNGENPSDFFVQLQSIVDYVKSSGINVLSCREAANRFSNPIEIDNGFRITRSGKMLNSKIPLGLA
ncbi:polysaccharide deacetylase family protein [Chryseobacterium sp.]|uniref:polysaccharide deacetylase family protein n=1 Tax=Chryseobacterium sp. TaxID=1871047 RepID=UPI00289D15B0|nr:polysaccharide deacetylase family protein [Chryseobacterium sp.]